MDLQALKKKKRWLLSTSVDCTRKILLYMYDKVIRLVDQGNVLDVMYLDLDHSVLLNKVKQCKIDGVSDGFAVGWTTISNT